MTFRTKMFQKRVSLRDIAAVRVQDMICSVLHWSLLCKIVKWKYHRSLCSAAIVPQHSYCACRWRKQYMYYAWVVKIAMPKVPRKQCLWVTNTRHSQPELYWSKLQTDTTPKMIPESTYFSQLHSCSFCGREGRQTGRYKDRQRHTTNLLRHW